MRLTDVRQHHRFMPRLSGAGHNEMMSVDQIPVVKVVL